VSSDQSHLKGGGEVSGSSPQISDGSHDGQVGRVDRVSGGQKTLKAKLNLKARVH
jgi:hypothetical protein